MRLSRNPKALATTASAVLLVLIGAGCHGVPGTTYVFDEESAMIVLAPQADNSLAVVAAQEHDPGSASQVAIDASPTGGLGRTLSGLTGTPQVVSASFTSAPMPANVYFDLDQAVGGRLYISNLLDRAGTPESIFIITELFVDGTRVGGSVYEHVFYSTEEDVWDLVSVYFRPEASIIPKGAVLEVKVSVQGGLADVLLGTGGNHASRLELAYYPYDPLAGAVFLERGRLVTAASGEDSGESLRLVQQFMQSPEFEELPPGHYVVRGGAVDEPPSIGVHPALILPLPLLLLGLAGGPRLPGRPLAGVLVVAMIVLGGCAGAPAEGSDGNEGPDIPKPTVDSKFKDVDDEKQKEQQEAGVGSIVGTIMNYFGLPVQGAHVSILATNKFTTSGPKGGFEIHEVPAGKYMMRIDAKDLDTLEREVEVQVAKVNELKITMVPPNGTRSDKIEHLHDEWRGVDVKQLFQETLEPSTYIDTTTVDGVGGRCMYGDFQQGTHGTNTRGPCMIPITFDAGTNKVLPGTSVVEVTLEWDDSGSNIPALGLQYSNALRGTRNLNEHLPRGPGEPFLLQIFPNQADPGHQQFSNWQFWVVGPARDLYGTQPIEFFDMSTITATATIHKGILPYEPKHVDRWGDKTEFQLVDGSETVDTRCLCSMRQETSYRAEDDGWYSESSATWRPAGGTFAPPGTERIEGKLIRNPSVIAGPVRMVDAPHIEYSLGYKPADMPPSQAQGNLLIAEVTPVDDGFEFTIFPTDKQVDQWYQGSSQWSFWLLMKTDAEPYYEYYTWRLEATAIKDPNWDFEAVQTE